MYGTQTKKVYYVSSSLFENDVKMYGTQTEKGIREEKNCLRMM